MNNEGAPESKITPLGQYEIDFDKSANKPTDSPKIQQVENIEEKDSKGRNKQKIMEDLRLTDIGAKNKGLYFDDKIKEWILEGKSADAWKIDDDNSNDIETPWNHR